MTKFIKNSILLASIFSASAAQAVIVTADLEVMTIPNVGNSFQTVALENTYTSAIPVCTYNLPSIASVPAVVRIDNITASSFDVRIQNPANASTTGTVTPGDVHCFITDEGVYTLPDGLIYEARTVVSTGTNSQPLGWGSGNMENVTASLSRTYISPIVIGQVISSNDAAYSTFWTTNGTQTSPPTGAAILVGKQIGQDNTARANETLGYIVAEAGTGTGNVNGVDYEIALGADTIAGVTVPGAYALSKTFSHGIASHSAMDGGQGGWAVLFGATPLASNAIRLGIDEDLDRAHTTEQVAYWVFDPVNVANTEVTIDDASSIYNPGATNVYTVDVTNNGPNDATLVNLVFNAPAGTTISSWTCSATGGAACPNLNGAGDINETAPILPNAGSLSYSVSVDVPSSRTGNLAASVAVSNTNIDPDTTNDSASDTDTQLSLADIAVFNDDGRTDYQPGGSNAYVVVVQNNGPSDASNVNLVNAEPAQTVSSAWSCTASAGASCPANSGSGSINELAAALPAGESLTYNVTVDVSATASGPIANTATVSATEGDPDNTNNTSTDTNTFEADSDGDGIIDSVEIGADPANPVDSDGDSIPDYLEHNFVDTDGDGLNNNIDADDDNDGLTTRDELGKGGFMNPADSDGDSVPDYLQATSIQTGIDGGALSWMLLVPLLLMFRIK